MDKEIIQMFYEYLPASELIVKLKMHQRDLVLRAMRNQVKLYYPVRSEKHLTYYPLSKIDTPLKSFWMALRTLLLWGIGLENRRYATGQIVPIRGIHNLNALALNSLTETLVFGYCFDSDSVIQRHEYIRNKFHPIHFDDVLVRIDDALELRQLILSEKAELEAENQPTEDDEALNKPKTKQAQREEVFLTWLADKDELEVSNMKKDEVWAELRNIDPHLFVSEPKAFFRVQQIITFKSGRKATQED